VERTVSDKDLSGALAPGQDLSALVGDWLERFPGFFISAADVHSIVRELRQNYPDRVAQTISAANRVCLHRIVILGQEFDLGEPINWQKDYLSGHTWPMLPYWRLERIRLDDDSDIKYPWELSRFHHGVQLGKAYALTGDEKYAREFVAQFRDWTAENPVYHGANWACTMEVAIRAVNLIWSAFLIRQSAAFSAEVRLLFLKAMLAHGRFIFRNLEYSERLVSGKLQPLNGNHYLSDLVGLGCLALLFPFFKEAARWQSFAINEFCREVVSQVDADGVDHEYSCNYHRLVFEMAASLIRLVQLHGVSLPQEVLRRAERMAEFIWQYSKPDGRAPLVRDIDSGRFLILGNQELETHTHAQAIGAVLFGRADLLTWPLPEDLFWLFGRRCLELQQDDSRKRPPPRSRGFKHSGFYVLREGPLYLLALACPVGMKGHCGHSHNDLLSFELHAHGQTFLADPGAYVYSRYPHWRNRFRATSSHNTVQVDGQEINAFDPRQLFSISNHVAPWVRHWITNEQFDSLEAEYRLPDTAPAGICHRRQFYFNKTEGFWMITDHLLGSGTHTLETRFHFNHHLNVTVAGNRLVAAAQDAPASRLLLIPCLCAGERLQLEEGWVSSVYGSKHPATVAKYTYVGSLPFEQRYLLLPTGSARPARSAHALQQALAAPLCAIQTAPLEGLWRTHAAPEQRALPQPVA
jgi:hypothetical protein